MGRGLEKMQSVDLDVVDLDEMHRRAQARLDWDGGSALSKDVPPAVIVALIDEVRRLRKITGGR